MFFRVKVTAYVVICAKNEEQAEDRVLANEGCIEEIEEVLVLERLDGE